MLNRVLAALTTLCPLFQSHRRLALENLALRQQLAMRESSVKPPHASALDSFFWVLFATYVNGWRAMLHALHPDTAVRWHRKGFRRYWRWKSRRRRVGRPPVDREIRDLIREMQSTNTGWGAPRIHGERLKLGIAISQATVSKYMASTRKPPSQTWRTFLENHVADLASIDFFTVPTATFRILYVFVVLRHDRREIVHFNVTELDGLPNRSWRPLRLIRSLVICCEIAMPSTATLANNASKAWVSRRRLQRFARLGRIHLSNALSVPFAESVWITSSCLIANTCAGSFANTSATTMTVGRIYR
jgi:hypothetical protein